MASRGADRLERWRRITAGLLSRSASTSKSRSDPSSWLMLDRGQFATPSSCPRRRHLVEATLWGRHRVPLIDAFPTEKDMAILDNALTLKMILARNDVSRVQSMWASSIDKPQTVSRSSPALSPLYQVQEAAVHDTEDGSEEGLHLSTVDGVVSSRSRRRQQERKTVGRSKKDSVTASHFRPPERSML